jgi:heme oxygenase (mycobilin-producing)
VSSQQHQSHDRELGAGRYADWKVVHLVAEPLTLINAFEVAGDEAERFVAAWEKARDYLAGQPGYVGTALHQAVSPGTDFPFVNIAHWRSADDFAAATRSPGFRESAAGLAGYRSHPGLYRTVHR